MEKYYLYITLTRTNTVLSNLIRIFKNDEYTHAAISLDKNLTHMYSFGRIKTYNPFIGGFKKENLNEGVYRLCNTLPGVIIEVEVSRQQYEAAKVILNHFISNGHLYKYNYMGLLHSLLNRPVYSNYSFLCSEFVYYVLRESGVADLNLSGNMVRPQSLLNIEGRMILKGNLKEIELFQDDLYSNEIGTRMAIV